MSDTKIFEVYGDFGTAVIHAEDVYSTTVLGEVESLKFVVDDNVVAKFYGKHVAGWVMREAEE